MVDLDDESRRTGVGERIDAANWRDGQEVKTLSFKNWALF